MAYVGNIHFSVTPTQLEESLEGCTVTKVHLHSAGSAALLPGENVLHRVELQPLPDPASSVLDCYMQKCSALLPKVHSAPCLLLPAAGAA